jgi:hypothetical protein
MVTKSSISIGERLLVLFVALAVFAYLLYRLVESWGQWPEDAWSSAARIVELGFVAIVVIGAAAYVLWPRVLEKGTAKNLQGDVAKPDQSSEHDRGSC